jgi:hypothetical protein
MINNYEHPRSRSNLILLQVGAFSGAYSGGTAPEKLIQCPLALSQQLTAVLEVGGNNNRL